MQAAKFRRIAAITIFATLALIAVGGTVRAMGAGLGCPDWPRCFGSWIPPFSADQIPAAFFEQHPEFSRADFNAVQTWAEYINRLIGVTIGILIIITTIRAWKLRATHRGVFPCALAALIMVAYQGWLGGQVVKSKLAEWLITVHMLLAVLILATLVASWALANDRIAVAISNQKARLQVLATAFALGAVTLGQVLLGTRVRETVDANERAMPELTRAGLVESLGIVDTIHRNFALVVFAVCIVLLVQLVKNRVGGTLRNIGYWIFGLIALQMASGVGLVNFGLPGFLQVLHLTTSAATLCLEFLFVMYLLRVPVESGAKAREA